ncbi:MAG: hypothetical protein R3E90_08030 [Marinicella sp.]|nr:hypothetical protein [Xanthomonadales bacterium]
MKKYIFAIMLYGSLVHAQGDPAHIDGKTLLVQLIQMSELIAQSMGQTVTVVELHQRMGQLDAFEQELSAVFSDQAFNQRMYQQIKAVTDRLKQNRVASKLVEFPQADPLPECANVSAVDAEVALIGKGLAEEVLAYAKWECEEAVLGENSALACLAPEVAATLVSNAFAYGEFCLGNEGEANIDVNLETTRSVGEHLNEFVDETIDSRADQESVDALQDSLDMAKDHLGEYLPSLDQNLGTSLNQLDQAILKLSNIQSQAESLLFRTQLNQVNIESAEIITSDVQQRAEEIRDDTQSLILSLHHIRSEVNALNQQTEVSVDLANAAEIEFALARNPAHSPITYQLPSTHGGLLETVRETLTQRLITIELMGHNVTAATVHLQAGDAAYNSGEFLVAYQAYAAAYKQLLAVGF